MAGRGEEAGATDEETEDTAARSHAWLCLDPDLNKNRTRDKRHCGQPRPGRASEGIEELLLISLWVDKTIEVMLKTEETILSIRD